MRYPVSTLKIDRTFVGGLGHSQDDEAIYASVVGLALAVGATCIAEGVETAQQAAALRGFGCQHGQGFLWSKAIPLDELAAALTAGTHVTPGSTVRRLRRRSDSAPLALRPPG